VYVETFRDATFGRATRWREDSGPAGTLCFDAKLYGGHSWRIGAATTLALNGVPEYMIKDIGGWSRSSSAFNVYFARAPQSLRASFSEFFSRPYSSTSGTPSNGVWVKMAEEISKVAAGLSPC